jgi:SAM-dependent methyltransferase
MMNLKKSFKSAYFRLLNTMHRPFVKKGHEDPYHAVFHEFISRCNLINDSSILEIGSRNVTGITRRTLFPNCKNYVGFDIIEGEGVDIVGDAHCISRICDAEYFDFAYSISVIEHLLFPWKAILEINKVLKEGGYLFLSTHPVWPPHELPWDFWRFNSPGFQALINKYTGFELIDIKEGLPCKIYSLVDDAPTRTNFYHNLNQGIALIAKKIGPYRSDLLKWDIQIEDVIDSRYPSLK